MGRENGMNNSQKIVLFGEYCSKCKDYLKTEEEDPCRECLNIPVNTNSHKPVYFKEKGRK